MVLVSGVIFALILSIVGIACADDDVLWPKSMQETQKFNSSDVKSMQETAKFNSSDVKSMQETSSPFNSTFA
ncbi:hypothetical protein DK846_16000 [Methanospirillum lacunae]|uniref:Uncharacterized protein n=2 Tax=Methanospirillum lacunae TaxID=668570 RepID=A0A2V2MNZ3_9EURY|nr:hypothetical protein DK846_16000 [Methanospirillum lacunae]